MLLPIANTCPYFIEEIKEVTTKKLQTRNLPLRKGWFPHTEYKSTAPLGVACTSVFIRYLIWRKHWSSLLDIPTNTKMKKSKIRGGGRGRQNELKTEQSLIS